MKLALFDFDGTITTHDSYRDFLIFAVGKVKFLQGMIVLSPWLLMYVLKLIPNDKAKQKVMEWFFAGLTNNELEDIARRFAHEKLPSIVKQSALAEIKWHLQHGHRVIIVSASIEMYLKYWCKANGIEIVGTKLEVFNGKITGEFAGKNCWGPEKVERVKKYVKIDEFKYIYAYGDTRGDREMLLLADEAGYRNFK